MMRYCRLGLAVCFLTILTVIGLPGSLLADQKPNLSLEEAINLVKENFTIPEAYKEFSSNYETNYGQAAWVLSWRAAEAPYGEFHAQVDVKTGDIIRMNNWGQDSNAYNSTISRAQARDLSAQLLERLLPDRIDELQWVPDDELISPLDSSGALVYTLRWQRVHQGIPFPENGATFQVRSGDGRILEYSLTWSSSELPSPSGIISADQARQVFEESSLLELQYSQPDYVKPGFSYQKNPMLVYRVGAHGAVAIDAFSGQPVNYWINSEVLYDRAGGMGGMEKSAAPTSLSPEEQQEVNNSSQAISSEQAVQAVKKWFNIPADLSLTQSNLVSQGSAGGKVHIWNLSWQNVASQGSGYVNARVNARSGEVIGYSQDWSRQTGKSGLSDEEARQAAEDFLKRIQPGRFLETTYEEPQGRQTNNGDPLRYFNYYRVVNGIPFPGNYLNLTINTQDRSIVAYELNWTEASFPSSAGVLNKQEISSRFLKDRPLTLSYAVRQDPGKPVSAGQEQIGLVYKPLYGAYATRADKLDAISGQPLDWQGNPIVVRRAFAFDDIEGDPAQADINAVGQAGLFGEYGTSFHPQEGLTMQSLLTNLIKARDPYLDPKPDDLIREARSRGWIKEEVQLEQLVDRANMARIMVRFIGLDRAAQAKGIYTLPYPDAQDISADFYGYVALAHGLDMVKGGADAYEPGRIVTRSEAASSLIKAMKSN